MNEEEKIEQNILEPIVEDVVDFEYNADGEEDLKATLKKLRADLKQANTEKQEYLTNWQKERADFINYKKDELSRVKKIENLARENFAESLFSVLDAYDMAFSNKEAWEKVDKNWRIGVEYIHQQFLKVLFENGIEEISSKEGDVFDPKIHQSVEVVKGDGVENTLAKILQKGYKNNDHILRPVRVNVWG